MAKSVSISSENSIYTRAAKAMTGGRRKSPDYDALSSVADELYDLVCNDRAAMQPMIIVADQLAQNPVYPFKAIDLYIRAIEIARYEKSDDQELIDKVLKTVESMHPSHKVLGYERCQRTLMKDHQDTEVSRKVLSGIVENVDAVANEARRAELCLCTAGSIHDIEWRLPDDKKPEAKPFYDELYQRAVTSLAKCAQYYSKPDDSWDMTRLHACSYAGALCRDPMLAAQADAHFHEIVSAIPKLDIRLWSYGNTANY